ARLAEQRPGLVVLGMADPDAEVRVDPAAAVDLRDPAGRLALFDLDARQDRLDALRALLELRIELLEEQLSRTRVVLPRILAVERERDGRGVTRRRNPLEQVGDCCSGLAARVAETDRVGEIAVAEEHGDVS